MNEKRPWKLRILLLQKSSECLKLEDSTDRFAVNFFVEPSFCKGPYMFKKAHGK